jgi:class 3 adenylate cyclase/tetratricopeptide (TPR) repeat protein
MKSVPDAPQLREERKVVTALFADLVGSTAVGERFDPEDAREIVSGAIALMIEAVERFGGTVKDLAGDGVLALYGAPVSHEDDVERAILAGLAITHAMTGYADGVAREWGHEGLGVRVGVETGLAVLGPVGAGGRVEYGAVGDVLNTAARLQSAARPGTVLVGEAAQREAAALFEWEPAGSLSLKGKDEPVVAAVAAAPRGTATRTDRRQDAPFVGRAAELAAMEEALSGVVDGRGSAVLVIGEPGIGKSRLVAECRRRAVSGRYDRPITWLEGRSLSWADGLPYGLFRDLLAGWLGVAPDDPSDRVAASLAEAARSIEAFDQSEAELLGLVFSAGRAVPATDGTDAEAVRERVFHAVTAILSRLGASRPLVISLEDVHWADPTSLALTERLLDAVPDAPLLVLVTRRPGVEHPSAAMIDAAVERLGPGARTLVLGPLSDREHQELFGSILGEDDLPDHVRRAVFETTEGNPLFLEEQIKALEETGRLVVDRDGRWRFGEGAALDIPRTVERVLLARIDRLAPADKDVLVAASVLGREFEPALLDRLMEDERAVRPALDRLGEIDLIRAERHGADVRFRFKHALIQEAAYRSLLKRRRRELHGRAAAAIESSYEGRTDQVAGALGRHLQEASELERAAPYLITAGDRARQAFANEEALSWYGRALDAVGGIAERTVDDEWTDMEADLQVRRATVLALRGRYDEARQAYRRSLELVAPDDPVKAATIRTKAASIEIDDHRYHEALAELDRAEQALAASAEAPPEDRERLDVWLDIQDARMAVFYWRGDLEAYGERIDRVRPIIESRGTPRQRAAFFDAVLIYHIRRELYVLTGETVDIARAALDAAEQLGDEVRIAWSRFELGFTLLWADRLDEAGEVLRASMHEGDRIGDVTLRSRTRTYLLVLDRKRGDPDAVEQGIDSVIEAAREASLPEYEAIALANRSWIHALADRDQEAEVDARAALELWRSLPVRYPFEWMALWPIIRIELGRGRVAAAITCARDMMAEHQQPLPTDMRTRIQAAIEGWDDGNVDRAEDELRSVLPRARQLAYL